MINDWNNMISKDCENNLLNLLVDIENVQLENPDISLQKINVFEAAGLVRQEIKHSKTIAYLLNPYESHGLGDMFFKKIITNKNIREFYQDFKTEYTPSPLWLALSEFDDLVVRTEDMQIDILAWSPKNKLVVAIENKVGASESKNQLSKYRVKINNDPRFKDYKKLFIFLTVEGDRGSDDEWIPTSYKLVLEILDEIVNKSTISQDAAYFINQYIQLIRKHIVEEENEEFKSVCLALYEKHKNILDLIYKNIDLGGSRDEAINMFIHDFKSSIVVNYHNNTWFSFTPKALHDIMIDVELTKSWHKQTKPLVFFFNLYEDRIKLVIEVGPIKDLEIRNSLVKALYKNIKNIEKEAKSDTYTRVWTKQTKLDTNLDIDDIGSNEVFNIMKDLYSQSNVLISQIKVALSEISLKNA